MSKERVSESVLAATLREDHAPGLDIGVGGSELGQRERISEEIARDRVGQETTDRAPIFDNSLEIEHGDPPPGGPGHALYLRRPGLASSTSDLAQEAPDPIQDHLDLRQVGERGGHRDPQGPLSPHEIG